MIQDTKIIILAALVQKLWSKSHFRKIAENIMYMYMEFVQTTKDIFASEKWS